MSERTATVSRRSPSAVRAMMTSVVVESESWFMPFARRLVARLRRYGDSALLSTSDNIPLENDVAFLLSYEQKVPDPVLRRSRHNIVVHASPLPRGKGMSPLTWQILEGKNVIPMTLFEAVAALDAGPIYLRDSIRLMGDELLPEIRAKAGDKVVEMCLAFMSEYEEIAERGEPQIGPESRYRARSVDDSRLDPNRSIAEQFDLLRVVDNRRYPAFFELRGRRYVLSIKPARDRDE
jgi:methionyl-tRNA formyltransferase